MELFIHSLIWRRQQETLPPQRLEDEVYQVSTMSSLLEGGYDSEVTYGQIMRHGDFGVGAFNALDGELIAFYGAFYQITSDGKARRVTPEQKAPFAVVKHFRPDLDFKIEGPCDYGDFQTSIDKELQSRNEFFAILAEGSFEYVKVRTLPKQSKPYAPLAEVLKGQTVHEHRNVNGLLAGFRFPDLTSSLAVPGYHLNFIDETREFGGHVLEARLKGMTVKVDRSSQFQLVLPEFRDLS